MLDLNWEPTAPQYSRYEHTSLEVLPTNDVFQTDSLILNKQDHSHHEKFFVLNIHECKHKQSVSVTD